MLCWFIPSKRIRDKIRKKNLKSSASPQTVSTKETLAIPTYHYDGIENKLLIWDKEVNDYKLCNHKIQGLDLYIRGNNNEIKIDDPSIIRELHIHVFGNNHKVHIGPITDRSRACLIVKAKIVIFWNNCELDIGENFKAEHDLVISLAEPYARCRIGDNVRIAGDVRIFASDAHPIVDATTGKVLNYGCGKRCLTIGDYSWIGIGAILLKNAVLPEHTIVSAMSLVTSKFTHPYTVIAGNPAKVIMSNVKRVGLWSKVDLPPVE